MGLDFKCIYYENKNRFLNLFFQGVYIILKLNNKLLKLTLVHNYGE